MRSTASRCCGKLASHSNEDNLKQNFNLIVYTKDWTLPTMILVSLCVLYATLLGPPYRSEWVYLLTASLGPLAVAVWYIVFPFNPYESMTAHAIARATLSFVGLQHDLSCEWIGLHRYMAR
jgi:hypothetical protein